MKENPSDTISFYKGRDVSPYIFHFVKGRNPLSVLKQILNDNALKSSKYNYICYTESPLRVMKEVLDYFQTFKDKPGCSPMFEQYGIGIKKIQMFKSYNARPVIYGNSDEKGKLDESLRWRFEQLDYENWDFSWQREWRTEGKYLELPNDDKDVLVICRKEKEIEGLRMLTDHPIISLEWVENNHASDYTVEANASYQLMTEWELQALQEECEELKKRHLKNYNNGTV